MNLEVPTLVDDEIDRAYVWLGTFSQEAADRFLILLKKELSDLCENLSENFSPRRDEEASVYFARRAYMHLFRTSKGNRRSASGAWRIYYELTDTDNDGAADTVRVLAIRHAAKPPLSAEDVER